MEQIFVSKEIVPNRTPNFDPLFGQIILALKPN